jgi:tetratricopeptide (TPR) repeat protein
MPRVIRYPQIVKPYLRHLRGGGGCAQSSEAIKHLIAGRLQQAAQALGAIATAGSRDPAVFGALGFIAFHEADAERALRMLGTAADLAPGDAYHRALLAACFLGLKRYEEAIEGFRIALRIEPALHAAHTLLWAAIAGSGKTDAAIAALKLALHEVPPANTTGERVVMEDTTLCIVDCANHALAQRALRLSMAACAFPQVKFLSDREFRAPDVSSVLIDPIRSPAEYSRFMMKGLLRHIDTGYVLVIQWDGYLVNPAAWSEEFLLFDYVGARWDNSKHRREAHHNVGNGGFSLRSRALLQALQDPAIEPFHPEDVAICRKHRNYLEERHGITFAPDAVADRFSFEHLETPGLPFGFHGVTNIARFVAAPGWATMDYFFGA